MIERGSKWSALAPTRWLGVTWLALFVAAATMIARGAAVDGFWLEVEMANAQGGAAQLFYDVGRWYSVRDSARVEIPAGEAMHAYRFAIPARSVKRLRFDPADGVAMLRIGRMRLLAADGRELVAFGPEQFVPMHAIAKLEIRDGVAVVQTEADDPMLLIARPLQAETVRALDPPLAGRAGVLALGVVVLGLLMGAVVAAIRAAAARGRFAVFAGSFLLIAGARLWWLKNFSRPLPFWDDWKTGAIDLLMPLQGGYLEWETLFAPHGEHRILLTRLVTLVGSILNGEWDPRVAMSVSALAFAAALALLCAMAAGAGRRRGLLVVLLIVACGCLPFDVRNVYWGDQSQMYLLALLASVTLALAAAETPGRWAWLGGAAAGVVSLFTMGSGCVAPGIAAVICGWRARREGESRRNLWLLALAFLATAVAGIALYRTAPFQSSDYARTWTQFAPAFVARAAWPLPPNIACALVLWLPWVLLSFGLLRARRGTAIEWFAFGLGAWALVNAAGLAHGRATETAPFDSKYYTAMSVGVFAALLSTAALIDRWSERPRRVGSALIAATIAAGALLLTGRDGVQASRDQWHERTAQEALTRAFLATGDPTQLRATPWQHLPYWNGAELADLLNSPQLQPWLSAGMRAALAERPGSSLPRAPEPSWLTLVVRTLMKLGPLFAACGAVLLGWFAISARGTRKRSSTGG